MNLLFLTADDLDYSLIGFIKGDEDNITPNLGRLAARSHRFVNNRTVAPICMPSREAMMSGLMPHRSGAIGFVPINEGVPTLVTRLQEAGYFTAAIHKIDHMRPASCFPWAYEQNGKDRHTGVYADGVRVAITEAKAQNKPFFVNCNLNDPHRPFYGSPQAAEMDHGNEGAYGIDKEIEPEEVTVPPFLDDLPDIRKELAQYWNSVQRMDKTLGKVLAALEESGEADNTIVLFCADHGMPFPFAKATCYDHGTRVPAFLSFPGMGEPRSFNAMTANIDILPTLLELLQVEAPGELDGQSWGPLIEGRSEEIRDFLFTTLDHVSSGMNYPARAIQDHEFSLIFMAWSDSKLAMKLESMWGLTFEAMSKAAETDPVIAARVDQYVYGVPLAFYDLQKDPGQRRNVIDEPAYGEAVEKMKMRLLDELERTGDPQFENYRSILAGGHTEVKQDPKKYRIRE
ncbi:sulfatase family protein [Consotaella aegiceratis]|uniref:sulfatase family protein n=1 Tax=Consotaella aegiceratis TaxID=3097961 RepID=UPI002F3F80AE